MILWRATIGGARLGYESNPTSPDLYWDELTNTLTKMVDVAVNVTSRLYFSVIGQQFLSGTYLQTSQFFPYPGIYTVPFTFAYTNYSATCTVVVTDSK